MSTRGTIAVKIDGEVKGSYNHSDSYPTWLGNQVLEFCRGMDLEQTRAQARALAPVDDDRLPTKAEIKRLAPYTDLGVSTGSVNEWYCLLRGTQGDLAKILEAGFYEPHPVGVNVWSYVVDLDGEELVIYEGEQEVARYPFAHLPAEFIDDELTIKEGA